MRKAQEPTPISPAFPRRRDDLAWRDIDGELFIVQSPQSLLHRSNEVGAFIWKLCDGRHTRTEVLAALQRTFAAPPEEMARDLDAFLAQLQDAGLLEDAGAP